MLYLPKQVVKINLYFMPEQVYGKGWGFQRWITTKRKVTLVKRSQPLEQRRVERRAPRRYQQKNGPELHERQSKFGGGMLASSRCLVPLIRAVSRKSLELM